MNITRPYHPTTTTRSVDPPCMGAGGRMKLSIWLCLWDIERREDYGFMSPALQKPCPRLPDVNANEEPF